MQEDDAGWAAQPVSARALELRARMTVPLCRNSILSLERLVSNPVITLLVVSV
jgi:hypothetical protein